MNNMDISRIRLTVIAILAVLAMKPGNAAAQITNTDWENYATAISDIKDGEQYFLYNMTKLKYVNAGGKYGMAAILDNDNLGIRFTVSKSNQQYTFKAAINNNGKNCLGYESGVFKGYALDRESGNFYLESSSGSTKRFKMKENQRNNYIKTEKKTDGLFYMGRANSSNDADEWVLMGVDTYFTIIQDIYESSTDQTQLNISNLIRDGRFVRNADNANGNFWYGYINPGTSFDGDYSTLDTLQENKDFYLSMDSRFGAGTKVAGSASDDYALDYGKYGAGEIVTGVDGMLRQTITIKTPGTYRLRAKAFYYTSGENPSESHSYLFARTNGFEVPVITGKDKTNFEDTVKAHIDYIKNHYNSGTDKVQITDANIDEYFRYNVAVGEFLSTFSDDKTNPYIVEVSLTIRQTDFNGKESLEIGIGAIKQVAEGYLFLNDVELYYQGNYEFGIDAYNKEPDKVKVYDNAEGRRFNLRRQFNIGKWNALVLPVTLYAGHVTNVFGQDARMLKLKGINPDRQTQILFEEVDLSNGNKIAIEPGEIYLVQVTDGPDETTDISYPFWLAGSDTPDTGKSYETVTYAGPIYHFAGVTSQKLESPVVTKTYTAADGVPDGYTLTATGYYFRPGGDDDKVSDGGAKAGDYVMSGGEMYHLTSDWSKLMGTCWKLTYTENATGKPASLSFSYDGGTTGINAIDMGTTDTTQGSGIYSLGGQKISNGTSLKGLAKGIYIVNGKKYVVS